MKLSKLISGILLFALFLIAVERASDYAWATLTTLVKLSLSFTMAS